MELKRLEPQYLPKEKEIKVGLPVHTLSIVLCNVFTLKEEDAPSFIPVCVAGKKTRAERRKGGCSSDLDKLFDDSHSSFL